MQGLFRGMCPALIPGVTIPLITITFVRTLSFSIYTSTKQWLDRNWGSRQSDLRRTALYGALGGVTSGTAISMLAAPFELVKVERQLEYLIATQRASKNGTPVVFQPRSGTQAAKDIYRNHGGMRGFYIGLRLHMMRDMAGTALYFGLYDTMRLLGDRLETQPGWQSVPRPMVTFLIGSMSGITSWLLVYPLDLIKTQVQRDCLADQPRQSAYTVFRRLLLQNEGESDQTAIRRKSLRDVPLSRFLCLYRGLGISAVRSFLSHGITWSIIEGISRHVDSEMRAQKLDAAFDYIDFQ